MGGIAVNLFDKHEGDERYPVQLWEPPVDRCFYCAAPRPIAGFHRDHIVPRSRGGIMTVNACAVCNSSKQRFDRRGALSAFAFIAEQLQWSLSVLADFLEKQKRRFVEFGLSNSCAVPFLEDYPEARPTVKEFTSVIGKSLPQIAIPRSVSDHIVRLLWIGRFVNPPCAAALCATWVLCPPERESVIRLVEFPERISTLRQFIGPVSPRPLGRIDTMVNLGNQVSVELGSAVDEWLEAHPSVKHAEIDDQLMRLCERVRQAALIIWQISICWERFVRMDWFHGDVPWYEGTGGELRFGRIETFEEQP